MKNLIIGCAVAAFVALSARSEARAPATYQAAESVRWVSLNSTEVGEASWYGAESAGKTADGEDYDLTQLTAAHRTLPFNSRIRVTNLKNGRAVTLRVNDRGPNVAGRLLDVSRRAAELLGFDQSGKAPVQVTVLHYPKGRVAQPVALLPATYCAQLSR
jgi:rare lipoprotein A (peptidoglycan hydrolase)